MKSKVSSRDLEGLGSVRTATEKLYDIFLEKYRTLWGSSGLGEHDIVEMWQDTLEGMEGVEYVRKFSNVAHAVDYLLERVNEPGFDGFVIRDPGSSENFVILDRKLAEKALVLGSLP